MSDSLYSALKRVPIDAPDILLPAAIVQQCGLAVRVQLADAGQDPAFHYAPSSAIFFSS